ncbi:hypothetical protein COLSTE_00721 [Collinsella stercoris DSM 13279]|uniref:Uncharacterized protein n=1 Tax=Collinsella stercoris DSM 13279 TaxID=445975 RepID=B6G9I0_9ACTN|nr:hypothetical protein COLSTE_00721 [Collinsella stercoris DSM 13279]
MFASIIRLRQRIGCDVARSQLVLRMRCVGLVGVFAVRARLPRLLILGSA